MPYFAKLINGKTYDAQGTVFKIDGGEREISERLYNHLKRRPQFFEVRKEDAKPKSPSEMNREELNSYAEMVGVEEPEEYKKKEDLLKAVKEKEAK